MFSDPFHPQSIAALQASPKEVPKRPKSPPKSGEEWILAQEEQNHIGLGNVRKRGQEGALLTAAQAWPRRASEGERLLDDTERKEKANMIFGSLESIKDDIQRHAPWDSSFLDNIDKRLQAVEKSLNSFADRLVYDEPPVESVAGGLKNIANIVIPQRVASSHGPFLAFQFCMLKYWEWAWGQGYTKAFLTQMYDTELLKTIRMQNSRLPRNKSTTNEENEKGVEDLAFPNFKEKYHTVIPLPGKLEALPILDLVTKANSFPHYAVKTWRKIFYSEDTASIFQNTFWWTWMDLFHPEPHYQSVLFDCISDSFASLMISMNNVKHKDEVFMHYPDCLAQAVYSAFCHAFPKSKQVINSPDFLNYITDLTSEWITGVKSAPFSWERWPRHLLNPYHTSIHTKRELGPDTGTRPALTEKDVMQLSLINRQSIRGGRSAVVSGIHRFSSRVQFSGVGRRSARRQGAGSALMRVASSERGQLMREVSVPSRSASPSHDKAVSIKKSLSDIQVGPGPIFECVRFSTLGRSPLLQHYLYTHNLTDVEVQTGHPVSHRQIKDIPPSTITYKQLLNKMTERSDRWHKDYEREMGESAQEIAEAQRRYTADMRATEKKNKRVLQHRYEVTILAERLVASKKEQRMKEMQSVLSGKADSRTARPRTSTSSAKSN